MAKRKKVQLSKHWFRSYFQTVVAKKLVNGVCVGYLVGWKSYHYDTVRNIRENLFFKTAEDANEFRKQLEKRSNVHPTFEVVEFPNE
jgi:hypothetical protein